MEFSLDTGKGLYHIRAFEPGQIRVNDTLFTRSIVISPMELIDHWPPQSIKDLQSEHLHCLLEFSPEPEVILIGTGNHLIFPNPSLLAVLYQHQIGVEIMDTRAACRTYNVLMSEGRKVAAALLIS
jgi:uncharacterized protein